MSEPVEVTALGLRQSHEAEFVVDRPHGLGQWLFVRFRCSVEARLGGALVLGEPGDCLVFSPAMPQWYRGRGTGLVNDWLHLRGDGVGELAARYGVPVGALFRPRALGFVRELFEAIDHEQRWREPHWERAVALRIEDLFLLLGRGLSPDAAGALSPAELTHRDAFRAIRARVHDQLLETWSVETMARQAHLSATRFAVLYKRFFGISPMEDLLQARLRTAKMLLLNAGMTVAAAAAQSGFRDACYFSRLFHRRVGCPPSEYYWLQLGIQPGP
jgi:AraC-like DNA-binding protein